MRDTNHNKILGKTGENLAAQFLENAGYTILEKNFRYSRFSEIDIIAKDKDTIVFAEVKTRTSTRCGHPFEAINHKKLINIYKAGLAYLQQTPLHYKRYRIDVISVIKTEPPVIEHLKDVNLN